MASRSWADWRALSGWDSHCCSLCSALCPCRKPVWCFMSKWEWTCGEFYDFGYCGESCVLGKEKSGHDSEDGDDDDDEDAADDNDEEDDDDDEEK